MDNTTPSTQTPNPQQLEDQVRQFIMAANQAADQLAEVRRFRAAGWTLRDLGLRCGVAHTTVARLLKTTDGHADS
jgi:hypothetical protein